MKLLFATFILLFALSSCLKEDNTSYPDVTATADTIYGTVKYKSVDTSGTKVVVWPYGAATFKVYAGMTDVLASTTINTDGSFMLILPATVKGAYMLSLANQADIQNGTVKCTPRTVRYLDYLRYIVEYTKNGAPASLVVNLHTLNANMTVSRSYFFNFYDSPGTFAGTGIGGDKFNWAFVKGWGPVETYIISSSSSAIDSRTISSIPTGAVWTN